MHTSWLIHASLFAPVCAQAETSWEGAVQLIVAQVSSLTQDFPVLRQDTQVMVSVSQWNEGKNMPRPRPRKGQQRAACLLGKPGETV